MGLSWPRFNNFYLAGDGVSGANRRLKTPIHLQKDGTRSGKVFGDNCIEYCAGDTPLHHDAAETRRLRYFLHRNGEDCGHH